MTGKSLLVRVSRDTILPSQSQSQYRPWEDEALVSRFVQLTMNGYDMSLPLTISNGFQKGAHPCRIAAFP